MDSPCREIRKEQGLWTTPVLEWSQSGARAGRDYRVLPTSGTVIAPIFVMGWYVGGLGLPAPPKRPIYDFLCAPPELQQRLAWKLTADKPWFALTRRATLDQTVKQGMERAGQVITV